MILSKLTRLEYERQTHPFLNEAQLKKAVKFICACIFALLLFKNRTEIVSELNFISTSFLKLKLARRGSNYERLRRRYDEHYQFLNVVIDELRYVFHVLV